MEEDERRSNFRIKEPYQIFKDIVDREEMERLK